MNDYNIVSTYNNYIIQNQERILRIVTESLSEDGSNILGSLSRAKYAGPLMQIAKEAVKDYLLE